jgi:hypothetical protein
MNRCIQLWFIWKFCVASPYRKFTNDKVWKKCTVNFTFSEHGYSKLTVVRNNLFWPEFCPSLLNIKIHGYSLHGYKELLLTRHSFLSPILVKSANCPSFNLDMFNICREKFTKSLLINNSAYPDQTALVA